MWLSEQILFRLAKLLYKTEVSHSSEMKCALSNPEEHARYRASEISRVLKACKDYDVDIVGSKDSVLLDFGCGDGSLSRAYVEAGARRVVGVDIYAKAIEQARRVNCHPQISFLNSETGSIPTESESVDTVVSYDVFEHVSDVDSEVVELHRVLRPGGSVLIGTCGWRHPFAPHLWSTMPVPWAHLFVSERTLLRSCRRVYHSDWYVPNLHDIDEDGNRIPDRYTHEAIPTDYLNKLKIGDFEKCFEASGFDFEFHPVPFGSRLAAWSSVFLRVPWLREFLTGYAWFVLRKPELRIGAETFPLGPEDH